MKAIYKIRGWVLIRPLRWLSFGMVRASCGIRWLPEKSEYTGKWYGPNIHWWILYKTVGKFFCWLKWDGWRVFCDWTGGYRRTFPLIARAVMKIGKTVSYGFYGGECYHCAAEDGDPSTLSEDETGKYFKLTDSGTSSTENGTDHWFEGITICPKCGFQQEYGDSSL